MKYIVKFPMQVTLDITVNASDEEAAISAARLLADTPLCRHCADKFTLGDHDGVRDIQVLEIDEEL